MTDPPPAGELYGHLTGRKRLVIMLFGAMSGCAVAALFAFFARQSPTALELIIGVIVGAALGLSASLGEKRRKRTKPD